MGRFLRKITAVAALGPCPSVTHNLSFLAYPKFPPSRCPLRGQSQGQSQGLSGSGQQKPHSNQGVSDQKAAFKAWLQLPASLCLLPGALQLPFPRSRDKQGGGKQLFPGNISRANLITRNEWQKKDEPQRPAAQPVAAAARTEAPWPGAAPRVCLSHLPGSYPSAADEGNKKTGPLSFSECQEAVGAVFLAELRGVWW